MAEFKIIETQQSLPTTGTGVQGRYSVETGEGEVYRQLGAIGGAIGAFGENLYKLQGEAELTQRIFEANEGFQVLQQDLLTEPDPEEYMQRYNDYWAGVEGTEVKNGYARRRWNAALPTLQKSQQASIFSAYRSKIRDNHEVAVANITAQYIQGGTNRESLEAMLNSEKAFGMTDDEIELRLTLADDKREKYVKSEAYKAALTYTNQNPVETKKLMDKLIGSGGTWDRFPELTTGDLMAMRNIAEGQIRQQTEQTFDTILEQLTSEQTLGADLDTMKTTIKQMEGIDSETRERIWSAVRRRYTSGLYAAGTGDDPWVKTRDERAHLSTMFAIDTGKITTPLQIMEAMFPEDAKKLGPAFSVSDYSSLVKRLPEREDPTLKTDFADEWLKDIDAMFMNDDKDIPRELRPHWAAAKDATKNILRQYPNDYAKASAEIEKVLKPIKKKKTKKLLGFIFSPPSIKELRDMGYRGSVKEMIENYKRDNDVGGLDLFSIWEWAVASTGGTLGLTQRYIHVAAEMERKEIERASRMGEVVLITKGEHERLPSGAAYQIKGREDEGVFIKK